jgi:hypothetical protein
MIFAVHVAFLFGAYGTHFFGLHLPYHLAIAIWLGVSSLIAAVAYYSAFSRLNKGNVQVLSTIVATCSSLFVGVFLAFNIYGT